jgi:putative membrane protein
MKKFKTILRHYITKDTLLIFVKGMFMGIADIIPGVSGGTIALITGIYERLVHSLSRINLRFIPRFFKRDFDGAKRSIRDIDFQLFIPLIIAIGLAIFLMSNVIGYFLDNHEAATYAFFFGLILASAFLLFGKIDGLSAKVMLFAIAGFLIGFFFTGLNTLQIGDSESVALPIVFLSGMIAICAMILPGISGAFILVLLGMYDYMIDVLRDLKFLEIFVFMIGALIGILAFSRVLDRVLRKYKSYTLAFLIGLMLGTLRLLYQDITESMVSIVPVVISGLLGFCIIIILLLLRRRVEAS